MYFSTITQTMTFAAMLLFFRDEIGLGSNNGFADFKHPLNIPLVTSTIQIDTFCAHRAGAVGVLLFAK